MRPQRRRLAGCEVPNCRVQADNRASKQGNLFDDPSHHGDYKYVPQGNVYHRENPSKVVEEGKLVPTYVSELHSELEKLEKCLHELGEGLDHERDRRHSLEQTVHAHHIERLEDRSKSAYSMLEYERKSHSLRDELASAHRGFENLLTQHENFQVQHENLVRDRKNLFGILEKGGHIRPRKKPRTDGTVGATNVQCRMRSHPTWQFYRVRISSAMQYTKWTNELG